MLCSGNSGQSLCVDEVVIYGYYVCIEVYLVYFYIWYCGQYIFHVYSLYIHINVFIYVGIFVSRHLWYCADIIIVSYYVWKCSRKVNIHSTIVYIYIDFPVYNHYYMMHFTNRTLHYGHIILCVKNCLL